MRHLYYIFKLFDRTKTFLLIFIEEKKLTQIKKIDFVDNWFHVIQIIIKLIQLLLHIKSKINRLLYILSHILFRYLILVLI